MPFVLLPDDATNGRKSSPRKTFPIVTFITTNLKPKVLWLIAGLDFNGNMWYDNLSYGKSV
jgi:hypothetical protein